MNANELAEKLLDCLGSEERLEVRSKSASMLRQQAVCIAELEAKIDDMAGEIMSLENRIGTMTGYGHN